MIEPVQQTQKIRAIEPLSTSQTDISSRLRSTWLGKLYTRNLKKHGFVRLITYWIWRNGYPVYARMATRFVGGKGKKWRNLIKLRDFSQKTGAETFKLADSALVETPRPRVFPICDQSYLVSPHDRYRFPEIFVARINDAMTYGGTNLILVDDEVVCHDLFDIKRDFTSEEMHGRTLISPKAKRIRWLLHDKAPEPIPVAATFVDACAPNYAHWMTEVLPRIVLFCGDERFKDVPIVVNDGLHQNIMHSLLLVAGPDREIITLPVGRAMAVSELYVTSVTGYVPFGRRKTKLSGHSHGVFSPWALAELRNRFNLFGQRIDEETWPEKIFLRRNSGVRRLVNAAEVEKLLTAHGFTMVEPEKLTFLQQIRLFKNAKVIVSSTGAAVANAIGSRPGVEVAILMNKHQDMIYRYWNNMLSPLGIRVSYLLGDIVENHDLGIHGDFTVDTNRMCDLLEDFERK